MRLGEKEGGKARVSNFLRYKFSECFSWDRTCQTRGFVNTIDRRLSSRIDCSSRRRSLNVSDDGLSRPRGYRYGVGAHPIENEPVAHFEVRQGTVFANDVLAIAWIPRRSADAAWVQPVVFGLFTSDAYVSERHGNERFSAQQRVFEDSVDSVGYFVFPNRIAIDALHDVFLVNAAGETRRHQQPGVWRTSGW